MWLVRELDSICVIRTRGLSGSFYSHEWRFRKIESMSVTPTNGLSGSLKIEVLLAGVACPEA